MPHACRLKTTRTAALLCVLAVSLAACQIPDFQQIGAVPKFDTSVFVPDPTQFARKDRARTAVGPADLVDAGGRCAGIEAPAAPAEPVAAPASSTSNAPPAATAPSPRGIGLEMTECEVVRAAGPPMEVQVGANERGERSVVLTYAAADRPIYRFVAGRLKSIERGAEPPPEPVKKKKPPQRSAKRQAT
jgi:hypothetical protein